MTLKMKMQQKYTHVLPELTLETEKHTTQVYAKKAELTHSGK